MIDALSVTQLILGFGQIAVLIFVVCSMLAMGLTLTLPQIIEPLKNIRLVVIALVANFVLVPILTLLILALFPLPQGLAIGLLLIGLAAGAPFLPKLAEVAKGDLAFSVGLMVLLMVVTIIFLPVCLPLLLPGIEVNAWDIARSLIILMLIPLVIGLFVRWRYQAVATHLAPFMSQASGLALIVLIASFFFAFFPDLIGVIGTTAIIASVIFILVSFVIGYLLGGSDGSKKRVLGLGTSQRNLSAAVAVAGLNFTDPDVMVMVLVVGLVGLVLLMVIGGELGKRQE
jgi:predicted Na+-dependent transporter